MCESWYSSFLAWSMLFGSLRSAIGNIGPLIVNVMVVPIISIVAVKCSSRSLRVIIMLLSIMVMLVMVSLRVPSGFWNVVASSLVSCLSSSLGFGGWWVVQLVWLVILVA